jgi:hypothetical protein
MLSTPAFGAFHEFAEHWITQPTLTFRHSPQGYADSPDESRSGTNFCAFPAFWQDKLFSQLFFAARNAAPGPLLPSAPAAACPQLMLWALRFRDLFIVAVD